MTNELRELVQKLLAESWAATNNLGALNVDQIGRALEEARETYEQSEDSSASFVGEKASFDRCVDHYCSILIWTESNGGQMPPQPLAEIAMPAAAPPKRSSLTKTQEVARPDVSPQEQAVNELWFEMTANVPKTERAEMSAEEVSSGEEIEWKAAPPPPSTPDKKLSPSAWETPDELPEWKPEPPVAVGANEEEEQWVSPPPMSSRKIETADDLPDWNPEAVVPAAMPQLSVKNAPEAAGEHAWAEEALPKKAELSEPPHALTNARAREYWQLYEYFRSQEAAWPLEQNQFRKLLAQSACFSLEAEFIERLEPAVKTFWAQREEPIRHLMEQGSRKPELNVELKRAVDEAAENRTEWLLEGKFPHAAVLTSLRYMLATLLPDKFQPSLLEAGILLFFFGQQTKLGNFPLENLLHVSGISSEQLMELMFRLSRLHRLRAKILGVTSDLESAQLSILVADAKALLGLLESLQIGERFANRKVA